MTPVRMVYRNHRIELGDMKYEVVPLGPGRAEVYRRANGQLRKVTDRAERDRVIAALVQRHEAKERKRQSVEAVAVARVEAETAKINAYLLSGPHVDVEWVGPGHARIKLRDRAADYWPALRRWVPTSEFGDHPLREGAFEEVQAWIEGGP